MPRLGFGTWSLKGKKVYQAVLWALEAGYRLFDTAEVYGNEKKIGQAFKDSGIPREDIFITTKLSSKNQDFKRILLAIDRSLKQLDISYIDLYLIHWPVSGKRKETWKALEKIYDPKKARAIGVSNFRIPHLEDILEDHIYLPNVNQIEYSPFLNEKKLLKFCRAHNIIVEAYCPLTRAKKLNHLKIKSIGKKYNKSSAQILLRWGLQNDVVEIPRSGNKNHIFENVDIFNFSLNDEDMSILNDLNENYHVSHDSTNVI